MQFCRPGSLLRILNPVNQAWVPSTVTAVCKDGNGRLHAITVAHAFDDVPEQTGVTYCRRQLSPGVQEQRWPLGTFAGKRGPSPVIDIAAVVAQPDRTRVMPFGVNVAPRLFPWARLPELFALFASRPVMAWFPSGMRQDRTWGRLRIARQGSRRLVYIEVPAHRWLFGDSGSPVYIWDDQVLWLMGMIQSAQEGAGMVRYALLDIHMGLAGLHHQGLSLQL